MNGCEFALKPYLVCAGNNNSTVVNSQCIGVLPSVRDAA